MAYSDLHDRLLQCRYHGIAESTRRTYQSGLKKFESFCGQHAFTPAPASSLTLQYFCAYESQSVSHKTIKVYLAAIRLHHIENNMLDPTDDNLLHLVCRGIRRPQADSQRTCLPITINLMRTIKEQLRQSSYTLQEQRMLWAAFTMAFYGFFRVSELINFCWSDVSFSLDHISVSLHQSKTDPFRHGCTVKIFKTNSSTCPHHAIDRYRKVSGDVTPSAPLYQAGRFHPLSRAAVTNTLRQLLKQAGIDHPHYSSHSFRIGAATTAAAAGLPAWLIKNLGRWTSNAYLTYIHQQPALTSKIYELLSHTDASSQPIWEPDSQAT